MKKIISLFVLAFALNSCSVGDDDPVKGTALLAIDSVEIENTYPLNQSSIITVNYRRPTDCFIFDGFYIQTEGFLNTIAVQAVQMDRNDCMDDGGIVFSVPLEFKPTVAGEYTFRFYMGSPENVPTYEEHIVLVE